MKLNIDYFIFKLKTLFMSMLRVHKKKRISFTS